MFASVNTVQANMPGPAHHGPPLRPDALEVSPDGVDRWSGVSGTPRNGGEVEAGQTLGQAILAAGRQAPGKRIVSANLVFFRPAEAGPALGFRLSQFSAGPNLTALDVEVDQDGGLRAAGILLLNASAPDLVRRPGPRPVAAVPVPRPEDGEGHDAAVAGCDVRIAAAPDTGLLGEGEPVTDFWARFRQVPPDPVLHAGLLAHCGGHLATAGSGPDSAAFAGAGEVTAISLSLHAEVRVDRWLRHHRVATTSGDGLTHSEIRVHTEDGRLVASLTVEAVTRGRADDWAAASA